MPIEACYEGSIQVNDEQAQLVAVVHLLLDHGEAALRRIKAVGEYQMAVGLLIGQSVATGRALHLLCVAGRSYQAFPTARSLVENVINAHYIARAPSERAARFWTFRPISHAKVAEARYRIFGITEELDEIRRQAQEAHRRLGTDKRWTNANVRQRAEECGLLAVYDLYYSEASAFSHGDASTYNAVISRDGSTLNFGPSPEGIEAALAPAFAALYGGLLLLVHVFQDRELERALNESLLKFPKCVKLIDLGSHFAHLRNVSTS